MMEQSFVEWLLDAETPSIRYLTSSRFLNLPDTDQELQSHWEAMKFSGPIPAILAEQTEVGSWRGDRSIYTPKYTSTHWSMHLLTELAADCNDPRPKRGVDFMLNTRWRPLERHLAGNAHGWTCFWANLLRYGLHFGHEDDPRLKLVITHLVHEAIHLGWRCEYNYDRPCAWGAARTLWALAALPVVHRSPDVLAAIHTGLDLLFEELSLLKASCSKTKGGAIHPLWFRLNFPLFYQADILFVLRVLSELDGLENPSAQEALQWLLDRRGKNGRWRGASPFRQRTWKFLGHQSETDRWVSLQAALVLKSAKRFD